MWFLIIITMGGAASQIVIPDDAACDAAYTATLAAKSLTPDDVQQAYCQPVSRKLVRWIVKDGVPVGSR